MSDQNQNSGFAPLPDEAHSSSSEQTNSQSGGIPLAKIQTKQIAISREDLEKFGIEEDFVKKNPALVDLVLKTESMKDEERKYWFQLLPIMNEEQIKKLQNILQNEKDQLAELDQKYESEVTKLNEKQSNWNPQEFVEKRKQIEENEKANEANEKDTEEDILKQLNDL